MSWIHKLYETYANCQSIAGENLNEKETSLLPICHTTQMAQIELVINEDGCFKRARVIPKEDKRTAVPCTESSGGRSGSKPVNHPLCDKLQYIAKDLHDYGGEVTSGYSKNPAEPYECYLKILQDWCESPFSHHKAVAILKYVKKGTVIKDLVEQKVLHIDSQGKLIKEPDKEIPDIFKVLIKPDKGPKRQDNAFVRWVVETPGDPQSAVWTDINLQESWIEYCKSKNEKKALCYVTGTVIPSAKNHPAKIRNDGDKAKLISSNDKTGFTFRGRFLDADQAYGVGFEVTQKAHNILRWLISRQGYKRGGQAIVAWSTSGKEIPDPLEDTFNLMGLELSESDSKPSVSTSQDFAVKLNKKIAGYRAELGDTNNIVVMGLESAEPNNGRLAITYYREITNSDFLNQIENWHQTCSWIHDYQKKEITNNQTGKKGERHIRFIGAPSPEDIAKSVYGSKVDDKLRKSTVERILPCIIDGQKIPRDLVNSIVYRASNRVGMEDWEWNKTLSIACALYKKYKTDYEKEVFDMSLDVNRKTRDYLYGRLLALADGLEQWALNEAGEKRQTNAARLMHRFAEHPFSTWRNIELSLDPYKARLGKKSLKRQNMITEVITLFNEDDFISDKKLSGEFLLGYHCQREALWKESNKSTNDSELTNEKGD